jgi:hypothetical protein
MHTQTLHMVTRNDRRMCPGGLNRYRGLLDKREVVVDQEVTTK